MKSKVFRAICLICLISNYSLAQNGYNLIENIYYGASGTSDNYELERCRLDLYYPEGSKDFKTIVWFHGGGLTGGSKYIPESLKEQGIAVVAVNYRLSPKVKAPAYIEDAASAVAWVFDHITSYGGDTSRIYVAGHSAGAYLTLMVGMDRQWLAAHSLNADRIAALFPLSPQVITHFTIRKEQGINELSPVVDRYAPLFHVRKDAPPVYLMLGDRELEMMGRYEENLYFWRMLKLSGHPKCFIYQFEGYDHVGMEKIAYPLLLRLLKEEGEK
ncbi:MAG: alpha/beta hydrolase [Bacteroidales bacterium]|nr:alpha/beta hydrolase [Bacteroidales bacterium]